MVSALLLSFTTHLHHLQDTLPSKNVEVMIITHCQEVQEHIIFSQNCYFEF